jgi:predicted DsbA family dithiol-disulfide isomerase
VGGVTGTTSDPVLGVTVWSDYLCPWCWLGHDRVALLRSLGAAVTVLPYDLHPEVPAGGVAHRTGGRLDRVFDVVAAECEELGLPFTRPARTPNTRLALTTAELVRRLQPERFDAVHDALLRAQWVEGRPVDDPAVVHDLLVAHGVDAEAIRARRDGDRGEAEAAIAASMAQALEHGVAATPAFLFDGGMLVPGAQPRETLQRWATALLRRRAAAG